MVPSTHTNLISLLYEVLKPLREGFSKKSSEPAKQQHRFPTRSEKVLSPEKHIEKKRTNLFQTRIRVTFRSSGFSHIHSDPLLPSLHQTKTWVSPQSLDFHKVKTKSFGYRNIPPKAGLPCWTFTSEATRHGNHPKRLLGFHRCGHKAWESPQNPSDFHKGSPKTPSHAKGRATDQRLRQGAVLYGVLEREREQYLLMLL